jgi:hypothetical protein
MELKQRLKEVNRKATEVAKQVQETQDPTVITLLITEFANSVYMDGLKDGREKLQQIKEPF